MSQTVKDPEEMTDQELLEAIASWEKDLKIVEIAESALERDQEL